MDWTMVAALAAVAGAVFSWSQASAAKAQVEEAKAQAESAKMQAEAAKDQAAAASEAAKEARVANDLLRMDRFAGAKQLYISADGDAAFLVSNPMPKSVYNVTVECSGMPNKTAFIRVLSPNEKQRFVLTRKAEYLDGVFLEWDTHEGSRGHHQVDSYDIWEHIKRR